MNKEAWSRQIRRAIEHVSDRQYQEETWFGGHDRISSPAELYCQLFDDALFEKFLEEHKSKFTTGQLETGLALKQKMEEYQLADNSDPHQVIDDPGWDEIRSAAADFLNAFEIQRGEEG
jgi:hypothetical protein